MNGCANCGAALHQEADKAIGDGTWQVNWVDEDGVWTCPAPPAPDVDCHVLATEPVTPFEVEFTVVVHVLATDAEDAYRVAEVHAMASGRQGEWSNYDDCAKPITEAEF